MHRIDLPITDIFKELGQALSSNSAAVLQAPPGAGKSTAVPLFLKDAPWLGDRKIVMLAPRRLAARAAAHRMAQLLGEKVGRTVGYRVRMDTRVGERTRIEVVTEGVLTRMLQSDPALDGVGLVIFDEFHERSLDADLGLALCLDIQGVLNEDLKLLVMSATMSTVPVARLLGEVPVIDAPGRSFPVQTRYVGSHAPSTDISAVARVVRSALAEEEGSILVFLPGAAEIRQVVNILKGAGLGPRVRVRPLLGSLSFKDQDMAISQPPQGERKIVLATSIAETSLTIEGIGVVVDGGLQRVPRFDVRNGMSHLATLPVSKASADQRRGRAGRLGPGVCLRLWSEAMNSALVPDRRPEILESDLCGLALTMARWGVGRPDELKWLDPPPEQVFSKACSLLHALDALDQDSRITDHGREMADLPIHPRLAHMLLMAHRMGWGEAACDLAGLLTERDPLHFENGHGEADVGVRYDLIQARRNNKPYDVASARINEGACRHIIQVADRLRRHLGRSESSGGSQNLALGRLLAWAYPDRIARRRPRGRGRFLTVNGQGVCLDGDDPLAAEDLIVAVETDGRRHDGRVFRAVPYSLELLEDQFAGKLQWRDVVAWDARSRSVTARQVRRLGALEVRSRPIHHPEADHVAAAMIEGVSQSGVVVLPWTKSLRNWQARVCFLHHAFGEEAGWPDLSDSSLEADMEWLMPFLTGVANLRDLAGIDLRGALFNCLRYDRQLQVDSLAPPHWTVPSGSKIPIDYTGRVPVLAVRLQEMFGSEEGPVIAGGRQPLLIHLLSPAGRPVQVTRDLAGFWRSSYHEVKKELKGRYPRHYWPEDPLEARPTARAKPKK